MPTRGRGEPARLHFAVAVRARLSLSLHLRKFLAETWVQLEFLATATKQTMALTFTRNTFAGSRFRFLGPCVGGFAQANARCGGSRPQSRTSPTWGESRVNRKLRRMDEVELQ